MSSASVTELVEVCWAAVPRSDGGYPRSGSIGRRSSVGAGNYVYVVVSQTLKGLLVGNECD